jgi:hypothetical protein
MSTPTISVKVVCQSCGYEEELTRGKDECYDGTTCPNCDGVMQEEEFEID